ncbi:hypothetical protein E4U42_000467 [Claviceps africana]|uniref:Zn(2)-C6 fungal-type domain-containing protein n=1 Tax=Claviceps africana TaxID=83212 RepID=A0A8K0JCV8_9HYPO|nr:hypothetical protein E4U42_000467 [Claviceps africana]
MAQRPHAAGTSGSSPSASATSAGGRLSHPRASSSATTPAQLRQEHEHEQEQEQEHDHDHDHDHEQQQAQPRRKSQTRSLSLSQAQLSAGQHKRVYQACIPCRRRKVRCDLGSVDNPQDPPCVRCRRESKECFFSATRRKRKTDDADGSDADEYILRNGRKKLHADASPPPSGVEARFCSDAPLTPGGSHGRSQPLRRPDARSRSRRDSELDGDGDAKLENIEAQTAMRRAVYNPHDALDLLYKAATDRSAVESSGQTNAAGADFISPASHHYVREESIASARTASVAHQPTPQEVVTAGDFPRPRSMSNRPDIEQPQQSRQQQQQQQQQHEHEHEHQRHQQRHQQQEQQRQQRHQHLHQQQQQHHPLQQHQQHQQRHQQEQHHHRHQQHRPQQQQQEAQPQSLDTQVPQHPVESGPAQQPALRRQPGYAQALRAWSRFRFVRAGWFTSQEAIEYID